MRNDLESLQGKDLLTRNGASALAQTIEQFWHDRGHHTVRVEHVEIPRLPDSVMRLELYGVRSNLKGGRPPR